MEHYIHSDFKLKGKSYTYLELLGEANFLANNGTVYEQGIGKFLVEWLNNDDFIFVQTSGSTGIPKKIYIPKKAMIASAHATGSFFNLVPKSSALLCLSADYIAGKMMLVRAILLGLELDYVEPSSAPLKEVSKEYDFVAMVPLQVEESLQKIHLIKKMIIGGAKLKSSLIERLKKSSAEIYETYGMTETVSHIAVKKIGELCFTILPTIKIEVDNRNCLVIHAPNLYPDAIVTNDIVDLLNEKQFVLKGRIDSIINSGGIKIYPEELEEKMSGKLDQRFFFSSILDETLGEQLILIIEGKPFEINQEIFEGFTKFQKPKAIYFVNEFVEAGNNKINRKLTRAKLFP